mgnify:CR=1 FL=1
MNSFLKLTIGCDHAGYELKEFIKNHLEKKGIKPVDAGTDSTISVDYPDYAHKLAKSVEEKLADAGILICGSGNGVNMAANKHAGVRAAVCWNEEIARLARKHNDANIVSLPARFITKQEAIKIVEAFLETEFEGGRHKNRVKKI